MDPVPQEASKPICRLERELIIRDFFSTFNNALRNPEGPASIAAFLHPEVVYRPSRCHSAVGRDAVTRVCERLREAFEVFVIEIDSLLVGEELVLVEHAMRVGITDATPQVLMGFSSFRITDGLISEWHQVHA
jgi:hypothetical protein